MPSTMRVPPASTQTLAVTMQRVVGLRCLCVFSLCGRSMDRAREEGKTKEANAAKEAKKAKRAWEGQHGDGFWGFSPAH